MPARIAQALAISRPTALHYLNDLRDQGVIDYDGRTMRTEEIHYAYFSLRTKYA